MGRKIVRTADDKREGMTLGELSQFVQEALTADVDPRTPVRVTNGFRRQIQVLEVES